LLNVAYKNYNNTQDCVLPDIAREVIMERLQEEVKEDRSYSLGDLVAQLIEKPELLAFEVKERFYEIGSPQGLKEFEEYIEGAK